MCDLIYASESARFGMTEINLGILPGWGGTVRIGRAMPLHRAREVIYSGRKDYTARDMYEMGLLTRVFDADRFEQQFGETVANLAGKSPQALRMGKEVLARSLETPGLDAALALERNAIQWLNHSPQLQAAMAAFRQAPDGLVRTQRAANRDSDRKG
jgi:enoyl-CoA hydratase